VPTIIIGNSLIELILSSILYGVNVERQMLACMHSMFVLTNVYQLICYHHVAQMDFNNRPIVLGHRLSEGGMFFPISNIFFRGEKSLDYAIS
jgi:hypothetical protein